MWLLPFYMVWLLIHIIRRRAQRCPLQLYHTSWKDRFKSFKGCLPQILVGLFLNTLTHLFLKWNSFIIALRNFLFTNLLLLWGVYFKMPDYFDFQDGTFILQFTTISFLRICVKKLCQNYFYETLLVIT